jgi:hypothetical protein
MIAATLLFFPPSWPRDLIQAVRRRLPRRAAPDAEAREPVPVDRGDLVAVRRSPERVEAIVMGVLALHVLLQALLPFRHLLYPGDVAWTEEGHRFAWRMKLRDKSHATTYIAFLPSTGAMWHVNPRDYIADWQEDEMDGRPDMILQLAHLMADRLRQQGYQDAEVYVRALTALNGRQRRDLIEPTVNLAAKERSIWPADWLLPLDGPLRRPPASSPAGE